MKTLVLLVAWLASGPTSASGADLRAPIRVAVALDSLDTASGLLRTGLFTGDTDLLDRSAALREASLAVLDASPPDLEGLPWPVRRRWMDLALAERRPDWSGPLTDALVDETRFTLPPAGSASRGPVALSLGLNALQAARALAAEDSSAVDAARYRAEARTAFEAAAGCDFLLRDEAIYRLVTLALAAEDSVQALAWADSLVAVNVRSLRTPKVRLLRARGLFAARDFAGAVRELQLARPFEDSAEARFLAARAYMALGQAKSAARELERLIGSYGGSPLALEAYRRRRALGEADTEMYLTRRERASYFEKLLTGGNREAATDSLIEILRTGDPRTAEAVRLMLVRDDYRRKEYRSAEPILGDLLREAGPAATREARLILARILRNTGRVESMEKQYRLLVADQHAEGRTAAWELARELESLGRWKEAETAYTKLIELFPTHGRIRDVRYRRGFCRFMQDHFTLAEADFRSVHRNAGNPSWEEQAAYWTARCLEARGRPDLARALARAARSSLVPAGFYGVALDARYDLRRSTLLDRIAPPLAATDPLERLGADAGWPGPVFLTYRRGLALARLGQLHAARAEWKRAAALAGKTPGVSRALALAAATYDVYPEGVAWARRALLEFPSADPRRSCYERLSYPAAFYGDVSRRAVENDLDPAILWGIMRQESLYDPLAVSRADARGLLQILPATLERILRERGEPPAPVSSLFRPTVNIELGARFFADRYREFDHRLLPALASYNAGEGKARQWLELAGGDPGEVFLECIGYPETYGYVRRIVWLSWIYRHSYRPADAGRTDGP